MNLDRVVAPISECLSSRQIDLIISGSIGACESVRFIRQLRRLGARIRPWLTHSAQMFTTPTAVAWAANHPVTTELDAASPHISSSDALIIAPASANFISKLALGICDSPCLTLAQSTLGRGKPVFVLPNMEDSLANAPSIKANLNHLRQHLDIHVLEARREENKWKFPDPTLLADQVAHHFNSRIRHFPAKDKNVLITLGSTRGYVDQVRYFTNHSTGALGSLIAEELFRRGYQTLIAMGDAHIRPRCATHLEATLTNESMAHFCQEKQSQGVFAAIFVAAVLDYIPSNSVSGKISSGNDELTVVCKPTEKIISMIQPSGPKIGFKLGYDLSATKMEQLASTYIDRYGLDAIFVNDLAKIIGNDHDGLLYARANFDSPDRVLGKNAIATKICDFIDLYKCAPKQKSTHRGAEYAVSLESH